MAHVQELNNYLFMFPDYTNGNEIHKDELLDIYEYRIPKSWTNQFLLQNWNPQQHTKQEFREFCEWLETAKDILPQTFVKSNNNNGPRGRFDSQTSNQYKDTRVTTSRPSGYNKPARFQTTQNNAQKTKRCWLHGPNNTHDTDQCKVIGEQADKMRAHEGVYGACTGTEQLLIHVPRLH